MDIATNRHERRTAAALSRRGLSDEVIGERIIADRGEDNRTCLEAVGARHLSVAEAAKYTRLSVPYLNRLRTTGAGPAFFKLGSRVVYDRADIDEWLASHRRTSTSDTGDRG